VYRIPLSAAAGATAAILIAAPAGAAVSPLSQASSTSPYAPACNGAPQSGTEFRDSEVEPWIDVNPTNPDNMIGVFQQDRWSNGGANGLGAAYSVDGGATWNASAEPPFCAGGAAGNGGDFERATDPWVSFAPNGDAYFMSLSFNDSNPDHALLVSKSTNGGATWGPITTLLRENDPHVFNDKNSMTADYTAPGTVYGGMGPAGLPRGALPR
jgi:BNR/Asp-box repeat.